MSVENLTLDKQALSIGEALRFTFELSVNTTDARQVRLEYKVYYVKATGRSSPKVFQIREDNFNPGSHLISRKHSFENRSTRKHYPGQHQIGIIVNGVELAQVSFSLTV